MEQSPPCALFVDDAKVSHRLGRLALRACGWEMATAHNGAEALDILETWPTDRELPRLIIADLLMPVMGGEELLSRLAADTRFCAIPTAVITASPDADRVESAKRFGALAVLEKPVSEASLQGLLGILAGG